MSRLRGDGLGVPIGQVGAAMPVAYTPAITWPGNTIGTVTFQCVHLPGVLFIWGVFAETAGTANASITIPLPPGIVCADTPGQFPVGFAGTAGLLTSGANIISVPVTGIVTNWNVQAYVPVRG